MRLSCHTSVDNLPFSSYGYDPTTIRFGFDGFGIDHPKHRHENGNTVKLGDGPAAVIGDEGCQYHCLFKEIIEMGRGRR